MDSDIPDKGDPISWVNVALAFSFVVFSSVLSRVLQLDIEASLFTSAVRCIVQLALVGTVLQKVFEADNPWAVAAIAFTLNLLGTLEVVLNKAKKRHSNMFFSVLASFLGSTIPVSIIGSRFAMSNERFWTPSQYIPLVGILCGNTIGGVVISINYLLKEIQENRDRVEMYLAFGASRTEATLPIAKEALRFALTPIINQISVIGIIAIPGMMTGAILGGSSVTHAAKLQMIIMFMISAATALSSIACTAYAISIIIDGDHRVRLERISDRFSWTCWRDLKSSKPVAGMRRVFSRRRRRARSGSRAPLLPPEPSSQN